MIVCKTGMTALVRIAYSLAINQLSRCMSVTSIIAGMQGVGLLWPTGFGDLEVNFCRILKSQPTDRIKRGVQVGFAPKAW